ncbi:MAG: LexA family transcriptional regulator [candidate division WOR-3 bacterium]
MENLIEIGQRIKKVRKELGLTQEEFANKLGLHRNTIKKYENGESIPSTKFLKLLEYEFGINPRWILKGEGEMFLPSNYEKRKEELYKIGFPKIKYIPVIGYVSAGIPEREEWKIMDWIAFPESSRGSFALIVDGTSMEPLIPKRSIIIVYEIFSPLELKDGDIVVACIDGEYTLKRFFLEKGKIILRSENKNFKDIVIDPKEFEIYIKGKVEALYMKF